ncbi:hypothetical protein SIM22_05310 [Bacillus cereus group sp. BfR-BA-01363]|uniref:hypothetical protein n=1 Tax=Bacillus cereus group TaxID=86661 RepID=UPI0029C26133|nr:MULTISPECIES: hypothetical protein [Bacillus cereus group]MDX5853551.1 hypothetical protein [Bacillus cereus group sp. BfR-BA-01363]MEC3148123.1 hypothetical protein [Bacillus thuringiensis]
MDVKFNVYLFGNENGIEHPVQSMNETTAWLQLYSELQERIFETCETDCIVSVA